MSVFATTGRPIVYTGQRCIVQRTRLFDLSACGWRAVLSTTALLIAACSSGDSPAVPTARILTVSGRVVSGRSGAPIAGASVSIGTATATTGSNGVFQFSDVPAGAATLRCTADGFENYETSIVVYAGFSRDQILQLTPVVKSMSFDPATLMLPVGSTDELSLADQDGYPLLKPNDVTLRSDNEHVASVERRYRRGSEPGVYATVVGLTPGQATITAEIGGITATATISVVAPTPSRMQVAFVRADTIFVQDSAGAEPVPLVRVADLGTGAHDFALSRDRSMIAFVSGSTREICIARSNGSDRRCSASDARDFYGNLSGLAWTPDGRELVFSGEPGHSLGEGSPPAYEPRAFLFSLAADNMTMTTLVATSPQGSYAMGASWAPDGSKIAFTMLGRAIWTVNRDGSDLHELMAISQGSYTIIRVRWSPDGQKLALVLSDEDACPWLCDTAVGTVNADGSGFKVLTAAHAANEAFLDSGFSGGPEWSADGTLLAYDYQTCSAGWNPCRSDVFVARADNGDKSLFIKDAELIRWRP